MLAPPLTPDHFVSDPHGGRKARRSVPCDPRRPRGRSGARRAAPRECHSHIDGTNRVLHGRSGCVPRSVVDAHLCTIRGIDDDGPLRLVDREGSSWTGSAPSVTVRFTGSYPGELTVMSTEEPGGGELPRARPPLGVRHRHRCAGGSVTTWSVTTLARIAGLWETTRSRMSLGSESSGCALRNASRLSARRRTASA